MVGRWQQSDEQMVQAERRASTVKIDALFVLPEFVMA
jgi:hypothetical protein